MKVICTNNDGMYKRSCASPFVFVCVFYRTWTKVSIEDVLLRILSTLTHHSIRRCHTVRLALCFVACKDCYLRYVLVQTAVMRSTFEIFPLDETLDTFLDELWCRAESGAELSCHFRNEVVVMEGLSGLHDPDYGRFDQMATVLFDWSWDGHRRR